MGMGKEIWWGWPKRVVQSGLIQISCHREKTLGAKEPAVCDFRQPTCAQRFRKRTAHLLQRLRMIDRPVALAAGVVVAGERRDALQDSRLSRAVLADDDGDRSFEAKLKIFPENGKAELGLAVDNARRLNPDPFQIRRRQVDRAVTSPTHLRLPSLFLLNAPTWNITGTLMQWKWYRPPATSAGRA
jgi:hypothetical protein